MHTGEIHLGGSLDREHVPQLEPCRAPAARGPIPGEEGGKGLLPPGECTKLASQGPARTASSTGDSRDLLGTRAKCCASKDFSSSH